MYRNASTLQEQKGSGTDSVNVQRIRPWVERRRSGHLLICNPAAIGCLYRVPLIRDESAASGCLDPGCARGMQTFAETAPAAVTCNSLHSTFVPRVFSACVRHLSAPQNASDNCGSGRAGPRLTCPRLTWLA